ncbi:MAG: hypothetical protein GY711_24855 [bacterium]|nr:hypothetical protein [bacterium]
MKTLAARGEAHDALEADRIRPGSVALPSRNHGLYRGLLAVSTPFLLFSAAVASAQSFNVDVGQNTILSPTPSDAYGAASGQVGHWAALHPTYAPTILEDLGGSASGVTVVSDFDSTRNIFPSVIPAGDDQRLMEDVACMPNLGQVVIWTFDGLADGSYQIYTYGSDPSSPSPMTEVTVVGAVEPPQTVGGGWPGSHQPNTTFIVHNVTVVNGQLEMRFLALGQPLFESGVVNGLQFLYSNPPVGTNYCGPAIPNSSGQGATIEGSGSGVAGEVLFLTCTQMPTNTFGYFLAGQTQGFFNPPSSAGFICLNGTIGRFNAPEQIGDSGVNGTIGLAVDTTAIPVSPPVAVMSGETWSFQCWFRDLGGATSNFSDGLEVQFL